MLLVSTGLVLMSSAGQAATLSAYQYWQQLPLWNTTACNVDPTKCQTGDGSRDNPFNGYAIAKAVADANGGDVVVVEDGGPTMPVGGRLPAYWGVGYTNAATLVTLQKNNYTLRGESTNATILIKGSGQLQIWPPTVTTSNNVTIDNLTFDASQEGGAVMPLLLTDCIDCAFVGNIVIPQGDPSTPTLLVSGGSHVTIASNMFTPGGPSQQPGGMQLQIQQDLSSSILPLNSGYDVFDNQFWDGCSVYEIGMSNIRIHDNYFAYDIHHTTGNYSEIDFTAPNGGPPAYNVSIYNNVFDGQAHDEVSDSSAAITGRGEQTLPGTIDGLRIYGNVLKGTKAGIYLATYDEAALPTATTLTNNLDVVVSNNIINSSQNYSILQLKGGASGSVKGGTAQGNTLIGYQPDSSHVNVIETNTTTVWMNIANNSSCGFWPPYTCTPL
jgi:hypothetical protein